MKTTRDETRAGERSSAVSDPPRRGDADATPLERRPPSNRPQRGDVVGRYVVIDTLGSGGMGVVLSAYDPELERRVALKLLRPDRGRPGSDGRQRLIREAQAMAKLTHPNVAMVYDVGEHGDGVFVAMEFIEGQTLSDWVEQAPRPGWRRVLEVYIQAGQGLAAAHAAQLVHRDFKPANAMLADDGRVKVLDFGLVRPLSVDSQVDVAELPAAIGRLGTSTVDSRDVTRAGTLLGTPAYMSPEQFESGIIDARSDQFSYCVALYEALYGERPFRGQSLPEVAGAVLLGSVREPPRGTAVPGWVRRVLLRGLAREPSSRYPSMGTLLEALRRDPSRRRRRLAAVLALGVLAVGSWGALAWSRVRAREACVEHAGAIETEWNPQVRGATEQTVMDQPVTFAAETWERLGPRLDAYAEGWRQASQQGCVAHRVEKRWTQAQYLAATSCLAERRAALASLVGVLAEPSLEVLIHADSAARSLPRIEACVDEIRLARRRVPGGHQRDQLAALREEAVRAQVVEKAGRGHEARERLERALEQARSLDDAEVVSELEGVLGGMISELGHYDRAVELLRQSYLERGRLGDDEAQRNLAGRLARIEAERRDRPEVARDWLALARMHHDRLEGERDAELTAGLLGTQAVLLTAEGDYGAAIGPATEALARIEEELGVDHPAATMNRSIVADIENRRGRYGVVLQMSIEELDRVRRVWGDHHPEVVRALTNHATLLLQSGALEEGHASAREAVELAERSVGPDHPWMAAALTALANAVPQRGDAEQAIELLERASAIDPNAAHTKSILAGHLVRRGRHERAIAVLSEAQAQIRDRYGPDHPDLVRVLINVGAAHRGRGDDEAGARAYDEAARVAEAALGPMHPLLAFALHNLGSLRLDRGEHDEARRLLERALRIRRAKLPRQHPLTASTLHVLARVDLAQDEPRAALERLEEARTILESTRAHPDRLARVKLRLARVLVLTDGEGERALELARQARDAWGELGDEPAVEIARAWLRKQGAVE